MTGDLEANRVRIVFYDGVCALCNYSVQFILKRDPEAHFKFAPIQSESARNRGIPNETEDPYSLFLFDNGQLFEKSDAVLRIARHLSWPWKIAWYFRFVPRRLRDYVYDFIASHRYRWFGKYGACPVPEPEVRSRWTERSFVE